MKHRERGAGPANALESGGRPSCGMLHPRAPQTGMLHARAPQTVMHLVKPVVHLGASDTAVDRSTQRRAARPFLHQEYGAAHVAAGVAVVAADAQHVAQVAAAGWKIGWHTWA